MNKKVLIVDDDSITVKLLTSILEKHGFSVNSAFSGTEAISYLKQSKANAVLLDLNLPDMKGFEVLKYVRSHPVHNSIAIIIVTGIDDELETILGLEMGADDYIVKPFHQRELIARLATVLRRTEHLISQLTPVIMFDDFEIDIERRLVKKGNSCISLSFKEFEILLLLASNPGKVVSRETIIDKIGGLEYSPESRIVDMHISSIRKKLGDTNKAKRFIDTVTNVGYRFRDK
jgi:two-component system alkaline phosphatase synthesis response regulator PhoP